MTDYQHPDLDQYKSAAKKSKELYGIGHYVQQPKVLENVVKPLSNKMDIGTRLIAEYQDQVRSVLEITAGTKRGHYFAHNVKAKKNINEGY